MGYAILQGACALTSEYAISCQTFAFSRPAACSQCGAFLHSSAYLTESAYPIGSARDRIFGYLVNRFHSTEATAVKR
jgi:hypothetical protein